MTTAATKSSRHVVVTVDVPGMNSAAYGTGDLIGTLVTLDTLVERVGDAVKLVQAEIIDPLNQKTNTDLVFFNANPADTTFTNNAAFAPATADVPKIAGACSITTHFAFNANAIGQLLAAGSPVYLVPTTVNAYMAVVARAAPTYSTSALKIVLTFERV